MISLIHQGQCWHDVEPVKARGVWDCYDAEVAWSICVAATVAAAGRTFGASIFAAGFQGTNQQL